MSVETGLLLGLLVVVLGAFGLTLFVLSLAGRKSPQCAPKTSLLLNRDDAMQIIALTESLQGIDPKLRAFIANSESVNGGHKQQSKVRVIVSSFMRFRRNVFLNAASSLAGCEYVAKAQTQFSKKWNHCQE